MTATGIKVTDEELQQVKNAQVASCMWISGGQPLGDPQPILKCLMKKYNVPESAGLNIRTGEFMLP